MWTDRFVKLPCEFVKEGNDNLGTDEQIIPNEFYMALPMEISGYRKHYSGDTDGYDFKTTVDFKNRESILVELPIEEFEKLINDHSNK
jgi:hypothetical protein